MPKASPSCAHGGPWCGLGLILFLRPGAPVAQGIEHRPPEAGAQVRILPGAPILSAQSPLTSGSAIIGAVFLTAPAGAAPGHARTARSSIHPTGDHPPFWSAGAAGAAGAAFSPRCERTTETTVSATIPIVNHQL
jgi:hypothetical protein